MALSPEPIGEARPQARVRVEGHDVRRLDSGWETAAGAPGAFTDPAALDSLAFSPAIVPGTAASAMLAAGAWHPGETADFDASDWWFRTSFDAAPAGAGEEVVLCFDGIATVAEVHLNGERILDSDSMFLAHTVDVGGLLGARNELAIRCHALGPLLHVRRRPRARWRTRLVADGNLRFFRTSLLGRAPGISAGPAPVGPWREVRLERRRRLAVDALTLSARLEGTQGRLTLRARLRALEQPPPQTVVVELAGPAGSSQANLEISTHGGEIEATGALLVPDVAPWWPHTHGEPALYQVRLLASGGGPELTIDAGSVGFRTLAPGAGRDHDLETDGLALRVNGVDVFARGCVWTPPDPTGLTSTTESLRAALEQARDGGMNMLRIPGTGVYGDSAFYELCDELGILVWQDFMFANLDYPAADPAFAASVELEARQLLATAAGHPSLAVLCGNSEVEQQVAMLGLDPSLGRGEIFGELLPRLLRESATDAVYVPSAPCGGELPFRTDRGVANYYGVGGYRRPLGDARRAAVRFASECLALSNVPDHGAIEAMAADAPGRLAVHHPRWKEGVPRDVGAGWDFEDVRDHYLELLFGLDPAELRRTDHERYLELSRAVSGEVMAAVFGEWRRSGSPCSGGLVLWLRDLAAGAGWGVVDHRGDPKVPYHYLRRAFAPLAVWMTDEGLNGVDVHGANDGPSRIGARLRVALYRDFEQRVDEATSTIELGPHSAGRWGVETLLGRFVDAAWAYRFGPPAQDLVVASLERDAASEPTLVSQSMHFPAGRPTRAEPAARVGLSAHAEPADAGEIRLSLGSRRLAYCVRVSAPGFVPDDDAFSLEPGHERIVRLRPTAPGAQFSGGELTAVNLQGRVRFDCQEPADAGRKPRETGR
jgi:beta-mannosidase